MKDEYFGQVDIAICGPGTVCRHLAVTSRKKNGYFICSRLHGRVFSRTELEACHEYNSTSFFC